MTTDSTSTDDATRRDASALQREVRPVASVERDGASVRLKWASVEAAHNAAPGLLYALAEDAKCLRITRHDRDRFTVCVEGMASTEVDAMSHEPREMLLAAIAEMLLGPHRHDWIGIGPDGRAMCRGCGATNDGPNVGGNRLAPTQEQR